MIALIPIFPLDRGLRRETYALICANTTVEPSDSFGMLSMLFSEGVECAHGGPTDLTMWNRWFGKAPRYAPGTARYAAFALGFGCGVALWEAGEG